MDTDRLKATWQEVIGHGDEVPSYFYAHLFVTHPELRSMFPMTMDVQRERLVGALGAVVSNAENLGSVVPFVEQLGRDHRRFSVTDADYEAVGVSLLWTLEHFLGEQWLPEVAADWAAAYDIVATTMIAAAERSASVDPPWWEGQVTSHRRVTRRTAVVRIDPDSPVPYRSGQSLTVTIPQRPRAWRHYSPANAPRPDGAMEFHVASVPAGAVSTPFVTQLGVGDRVRLGAPIGTAFAIDPAGPEDLLLVAGGTGLSPFLALLEDIEVAEREARTDRRVHLVHGVRYPWDRYAHDWLHDLSRHAWFDVTEAVSEDPGFAGPRGLVSDVAATLEMPGEYDALVCGSPDMVTATRAALQATTHPPRTIASERFAFVSSVQSPSRRPISAVPISANQEAVR